MRALAVRTCVLWITAVVFWTNDKFLCESVWHSFPYLHSGWHILIFLSSYVACVLFAYFQVCHERPELNAKLRFVCWYVYPFKIKLVHFSFCFWFPMPIWYNNHYLFLLMCWFDMHFLNWLCYLIQTTAGESPPIQASLLIWNTKALCKVISSLTKVE